MKYQLLLSAITVFTVCLNLPAVADDDLVAPPSTEEAVTAEKTETITGSLSVTKDDDDAVTGASITVGDDDTTYNIVMDENGKKLAAEMADKKVSIVGVISKKETEETDDDGETVKKVELWLTVKSFTAVAEENNEEADAE